MELIGNIFLINLFCKIIVNMHVFLFREVDGQEEGDMGDNDEHVKQFAVHSSLQSTTGIEDGLEDSGGDSEMEDSA